MFSGLLVDDFDSVKTESGIYCKPMKCNEGYFLPLGWESFLDDNNINYTKREDLTEIELI